MPGFDTKFEWAYEQASNFGGVARFELRSVPFELAVKIAETIRDYEGGEWLKQEVTDAGQ